jgi:predicted small secreted protein
MKPNGAINAMFGSFFLGLNLVFSITIGNLQKESLTMIRKFAILSLLVITTCALSACGNTFEGVGRDLEGWGRTMQETF